MINDGLSGKEAYNAVDKETNGDLTRTITSEVTPSGYTTNNNEYQSP